MRVLLVALNAHYMHTSLALRQLSGALRREGLDCECFESHINIPYRKLLEQIGRRRPDVLCLSCYIWNIDLMLRLAGALGRALPGTRIVLGGPEVGYRAEAVLAEYPFVDCVLSGEGEQALPALIGGLISGEDLRPIPGLGFRGGDGIAFTGTARPLSPEMWVDAYPEGIDGLEDRILYIETSRGCPYRCSYCLSSAQGGVRALDAGESLKRLTRLADQNAALVKLVDRTFNFDRRRANAIWRGLIKHRQATRSRTVFHFEIGAHLIDEEALAVLAEAPPGLFQFEVGIQSSDGTVLKNVERSARFSEIRDAVRAIRVLFTIPIHVDLIAGLPGEDIERFGRSFDDAYDLGADMLQLGFLKLLHGSALRRDADSLGIVYEERAPYEVLRTREMSFDELCHLKDVETALDWYYHAERYRAALRLLIGDGRPFECFSELARFLRAEGAFDVERGERARAEWFLRFGEARILDPAFAHLVRHGLLAAGRRRDLPEALQYEETPEQRALLRARYHPVRGQTVYDYPIDLEAALEGRAAVSRASRAYYSKDAVQFEEIKK